MTDTLDVATADFKIDSERYALFGPLNIHVPRRGIKQFAYNDGDAAESHLMSVLAATKDLATGSMELARGIVDWPSRYHLSPRRSNLLRPIAHNLGPKILEIGAGCGAITRFLGDAGHHVVALEGSMRRADIARHRCRGLRNVDIVADNFQNWPTDLKFNTVTLIGVLEYSPRFIAAPDPVNWMLSRARACLADDGALVLAIENQLGLKYFAGACEDHANVPYYGINGLYHGDFVTFGRVALEAQLKRAGFDAIDFYYPFPDYKMPSVVLNETLAQSDLPLVADILRYGSHESFDPGRLFCESLASRPLVENGLLADHANSFLVVARPSPIQVVKRRVGTAWMYASERHRAYAKETTMVVEEGKTHFTRRRLFPDIDPPSPAYMAMEMQDEEAMQGVPYALSLWRRLERPGWGVADIAAWARPWHDLLVASATAPVPPAGPLHQCLPANFYDCVPGNVLRTKFGGLQPFDLEWVSMQPVVLGHVLVRGIGYTLHTLSGTAAPAAGTPLDLVPLIKAVVQALGHHLTQDDFDLFASREARCQTTATGLPVGPKVCLFEGHSLIIRPKDARLSEHLLRIAAAGMHIEPEVAKRLAEEIFDRDYYLQSNPDIAAAKVDPFEHYMRCGALEMRNPSAHFCARTYAGKNPMTVLFTMNPLVHYQLIGRFQEHNAAFGAVAKPSARPATQDAAT